ncbi:MAG: four helix bundle protein [Bacteroidales bacterium]|nr:four helix bundle protein [Bacteroidales bacterium]
MKIYSFEKLNFWNDLKGFVKAIYSITEGFPDSEKFGLTNQMRRAAISISSNIAEGTSRVSLKDQAHFSQIAFSSLMEVLSQLIVANDLGYINNENYIKLRENIDSIARQINALRKSQLAKSNP